MTETDRIAALSDRIDLLNQAIASLERRAAIDGDTLANLIETCRTLNNRINLLVEAHGT